MLPPAMIMALGAVARLSAAVAGPPGAGAIMGIFRNPETPLCCPCMLLLLPLLIDDEVEKEDDPWLSKDTAETDAGAKTVAAADCR